MKNAIFLAMLAFVPLSFLAERLEWGATVAFIFAALAVIPLAAFMGTATEEIAVAIGPNLGGFLNATFGNATELILAFIALRSGLTEVVKATLTGSMVSNLLLVMGFAMFLGGLRYREQQFQPVVARLNASAMNLAVIAILLPTAAAYTAGGQMDARSLELLSVAVAVVLIVVYASTLLFSMKTHTYLYEVGVANLEPEAASAAAIAREMPAGSPAPAEPTTESAEAADFGEHSPKIGLWVGVLLAVTLGVAFESELLVGALEEATESFGFTPLFTGVILLPIIGNAAEHATAVTVAMKNKMDLSVSVAVGSTLQIALFVAPVLVLAGWAIGQPLDLEFAPFELVAVAVAVLIANSISADGKSNWLEGCLLLATYIVLGLAFFFYPGSASAL
ncbi:MAG: calcium/proton exchanger [Cyanobacteria bacterium J06641_5]